MKNEKLYEKMLGSSVKIRREINEKLWKGMNKLSKNFQALTGLTHHDFQIAKDMIYYQGGWPSPGTKPRVEKSVENFAQMCRVLNYLGRDQQLKQALAEHGLELKFKPLSGKASAKTQRVIEEALVLQAEICKKADQIKYDAATVVETSCEIVKPHFLTNVKIIAKAEKGSKIGNVLDKFIDETVSATMIATHLKKKLRK